MSSNDRSTSGPGGVKSLLAKFEAGQQSSAPTTPNPRGRSPAGVSNGNGTNGDSARQSSTVRTTFVSVERSTSTPKRKPTPSSQSTGSPSEAKTTPTSTTDIERDAEDFQTQAQAAINNIAGLSREDDDDTPAGSPWEPRLAAPPNSLVTPSTGALTPAPASEAVNETPTPAHGAQEVQDDTESTPKVSSFALAGQSLNSNHRFDSSHTSADDIPKTPEITLARKDDPQHLTAPVHSPASSKSVERGQAKSPAKRDVSMDRLSISPVPSYKDGATPDVDALQKAQDRRSSLSLHISPDAEDVLGPRPSNSASIRHGSDDKVSTKKDNAKGKGHASPSVSSFAKNASRTASKPKTPITPRTNGTSTKADIGSASKNGTSATKPATNGVRRTTGAKTSVHTGFHKPKPRSPTRPINLPAHLVAPTAASAAKHGIQPASETSRPARRASSVSETASRRSTLRASTIGPRRSSVKPSPAKNAPTPPPMPARVPAESFLERMMRPTASSASKVHAKNDAGTAPKRR